MGIDIASWRICKGPFHPRVIIYLPNISINSTKAIKGLSYRFPSLSVVLLILASLTICMDIEPNPGPSSVTSGQSAIDAYSSDSARATLHQYTDLFNAMGRIQLKLTRYKQHLLNYTFFKENNYILASLYPSLPPLYTENEKFHCRWRYISHSAAYRHLKLLITECRHSIQHLLRGSRITWNSCAILVHRMHFYSTQPNSIPWPLHLSLCLLTDVPQFHR